MNLDAFQSAVNKTYGTSFNLPIVYFTQLMGVAFGLDSKGLGLNDCIVSSTGVTAKYA
jgi:heterodisulfide reductase subunit B2